MQFYDNFGKNRQNFQIQFIIKIKIQAVKENFHQRKRNMKNKAKNFRMKNMKGVEVNEVRE